MMQYLNCLDLIMILNKSSQFRNYFHNHGRIHEISCVHTPVSERKHRHLLGVIRCLLFKMSVPKCYQPEALLTACSLVNRMPSLVLDNKTPYSILHPNKPLHNVKPKVSSCICSVLHTRQKVIIYKISQVHLSRLF